MGDEDRSAARGLRKALETSPGPHGLAAAQQGKLAAARGGQARAAPDAVLGGPEPWSLLRCQVQRHGLWAAPASPIPRAPQSPVLALKGLFSSCKTSSWLGGWVVGSIVFTLRNVSSATAEGPRRARLARTPSPRPGPAAPTRRPERATEPGGQGGGRPGQCGEPGPPRGLRETGLKGMPASRRPQPPGAARGHGHPAPAQPPAAPGSPRRGPRSALAAPLPRAAETSPPSQYELPAAFHYSQLRRGASPGTLCSMAPSHWLGGKRERRGERGRRGGGRSLRRPRGLP